MRPREKTHCHRGHPLTGSNVRLKKRDRWVFRVCLECHAHNVRAHIIRKRRRTNGTT